jgi:hypothetical protein
MALWVQSGNVVLGGGATASELRFLEPSGSGTNYTALKAQAQGANITYTLPATVGGAGTFLTDAAGNGTLSWGSAGGSATQMIFSTDFQASTRYTQAASGGSNTFTTNGLQQDTSAGSGSYASSVWAPVATTGSILAGNPTFTWSASFASEIAAANGVQVVWAVGTVAISGTGVNRAGEHFGFFIKREAGVYNLYGTQGVAANQELTSVLTTVADGDDLQLVAAHTTDTSTTFYFSKNGAAMSAGATLSTYPPTSNAQYEVWTGVSNASTTGRIIFATRGITYKRY